MTPHPLFTMTNLTSSDSFHQWFQDLNWQILPGELWCVLGSNGSGKSLLTALLRGQLPVSKGHLEASWLTPAANETSESESHQASRPSHLPALVSFEAQKAIMDYERWNDDSEFKEDGFDPGKTVEILAGKNNPWLTLLGLENLKTTSLKLLSSGEIRKALIARELATNPPLLILDEPYEALDKKTCDQLSTLWPALPIPQLFLLQRATDIPTHTTHILVLEEGTILQSGPKEHFTPEILDSLLGLSSCILPTLPPSLYKTALGPKFQTLVELKNVTVTYGDKTVLRALDWKVKTGDHWLITGPNGSGKTTLLSLINGENQQAFREDVSLFGRRRGSGETLWEIRRHQGVVSPALHQAHDHNLDQPLWAVVAGGFFDTIGLYDPLGWNQKNHVLAWLKIFGLQTQADVIFPRLSYGQQRLALLVRALVKEPPLLILDEPCQGLDSLNTELFLQAVDHIASSSRTTVLFVTHRSDEKLSCIKNLLRFEETKPGIFKPVFLKNQT